MKTNEEKQYQTLKMSHLKTRKLKTWAVYFKFMLFNGSNKSWKRLTWEIWTQYKYQSVDLFPSSSYKGVDQWIFAFLNLIQMVNICFLKKIIISQWEVFLSNFGSKQVDCPKLWLVYLTTILGAVCGCCTGVSADWQQFWSVVSCLLWWLLVMV